jgi:protein SCO1
MKRNAILGALVVLGLPIISYFLVDKFSKRDVKMPRHYFMEGIERKEVRGNIVFDTIWHKVPNGTFINQLGKSVSFDSLQGKIMVVNFFFTYCETICPPMMNTMRKLQKSFDTKNKDKIHFVSMSIDPEYDVADTLKQFADKLGVNHDNWWLLTTDTNTVYNYSRNEFKLHLADPNGDGAAGGHTDMFVLLDRKKQIRGYYHSNDKEAMAQLANDIALLIVEKNK